jgi:hypothetical protein
MDSQKPMPAGEKFTRAFGMVRLYQKHVLPFVEQRLGYGAMHELESVWQAGIAPIRERDTDEEKYQRAFGNWLWMARCSHDFLADQLDREGVGDYKRLLLRLYKQKYDKPALSLYRLLNWQASLIKAWAYEMQWMTPIEISGQSSEKTTCEVSNCRILRTPATERICMVDCRNVGTELAYQVYHLNRHTLTVNHGCTITLIPAEEVDRI